MVRRRQPHPAANLHLPAALAGKVGQALVQAEHALGADGREEELRALGALLADPEIRYWLDELVAMKLVRRVEQEGDE